MGGVSAPLFRFLEASSHRARRLACSGIGAQHRGTGPFMPRPQGAQDLGLFINFPDRGLLTYPIGGYQTRHRFLRVIRWWELTTPEGSGSGILHNSRVLNPNAIKSQTMD